MRPLRSDCSCMVSTPCGDYPSFTSREMPRPNNKMPCNATCCRAFFIEMAGLTRLELATSGMTGQQKRKIETFNNGIVTEMTTK
jgi:hypothetical protein